MTMNLVSLTVAQIEDITRLAEIKAAKDAQDDLAKPVALTKNRVPNLERQQLVAAIEKLPAAAQAELMAFTLLGKDCTGGDLSCWDELVLSAQGELEYDIPDQLASKLRLHEYLRRGLLLIGQAGTHPG